MAKLAVLAWLALSRITDEQAGSSLVECQRKSLFRVRHHQQPQSPWKVCVTLASTCRY
jgi:hypothetical protein